MRYKTYSLKELATIKYGKNQKQVQDEEGTIPIYGTGGVMGYSTKSLYDSPSVLIGRKGTIGKVKFVSSPFWTIDTLFYTEVNTDIIYPKYLYYVMSLLDLNQYNEGTTIPSLRTETLNRLKFNIPSIQTQRKILDILNPLDDKIELNNRINKNLEQQAQAIFKSWFIDFECFNNDLVMTPANFLAPKSLKMIQILNIPHILETGKRPKGGASAKGIPSIGAENVKELGVFDTSKEKFIPMDFALKLNKGLVNGYELMIYKDGGKPGTFIPHFSMFGEGFPYEHFFINEHVFKQDFGNRGFNDLLIFTSKQIMFIIG